MIVKDYLQTQFKNFFFVTSGHVTPEMFGAAGDGETNDYASFMAAVDFAMTSGVKKVKLARKYYLGTKVDLTNEKYRQLTIEGTAFSGSNVDNNDSFYVRPMNIVAPNGFDVGSYVHLKNVGFLTYGVKVRGNRVRFDGCVFNGCAKAIELYNWGDANNWMGEIYIDNCDFSRCELCIDASPSPSGGFFYDSRIYDCTVIYGTAFLTGRITGWKIRGNHIYCTNAFKNVTGGTMMIDDNYIDTNSKAFELNLTVGTISITNNWFTREHIVYDENNVPYPLIDVTGSTTNATLRCVSNFCRQKYRVANEYFVRTSGELTLEYDSNMSNINFTNENPSVKHKAFSSSNLVKMPKHANRSALITSHFKDMRAVCLTFDGWDLNTVTEIAPYLHSKGIPFTVFIGHDDKNATGFNMTSALLTEYHKIITDYGGEVQLYTGQPSATFTGSSNYKEQFAQLTQAYNRFLSWGFGKPRFCAFSGGVSSVILDKYLLDLGIKAGRTTQEATYGPALCETAFRYPTYQVYGSNWSTYKNNINQILNDASGAFNFPKLYMTHKITPDDDSTNGTDITLAHMKELIDDIYALTQKENYPFTAMSFSQLWDYIHFPDGAVEGQHYMIWEGDGDQHEYVYTEKGSWKELTVNDMSSAGLSNCITPQDYPILNVKTMPTADSKNVGYTYLYTGTTTATYIKGKMYECTPIVATPTGTENPATSRWYEHYLNLYARTSDTTVVEGKTYYTGFEWSVLE